MFAVGQSSRGVGKRLVQYTKGRKNSIGLPRWLEDTNERGRKKRAERILNPVCIGPKCTYLPSSLYCFFHLDLFARQDIVPAGIIFSLNLFYKDDKSTRGAVYFCTSCTLNFFPQTMVGIYLSDISTLISASSRAFAESSLFNTENLFNITWKGQSTGCRIGTLKQASCF